MNNPVLKARLAMRRAQEALETAVNENVYGELSKYRMLQKRLATVIILPLLVSACTWSGPVEANAKQTVSAGEAPPVRHAMPQAASVPATPAESTYHLSGAFGLVAANPYKAEIAPVDETVRQQWALDDSIGFVPSAQMASKPVSVQQAKTEVRRWCRAMADRLRPVRLQPCLEKSFVASGYHSVLGRPIVMRKVHPRSQPHSPLADARVLLIGGVHGDEVSSVSLVFEWLDILLASGTGYTWHVVPSVNPDGLLAGNPTRVNAHGVDINRNLPTVDWKQESKRYWRKVDYQERRYPGTAPASEPETRWLVDEIEAFRPDVIISVHAPYGVLDYNGEFPAPQHLGPLDLHRLGVFPGSLGNYASRMLGIPVITIELAHAWQAPSDAEIRQMWADLNRWLARYVDGHDKTAPTTTAQVLKPNEFAFAETHDE